MCPRIKIVKGPRKVDHPIDIVIPLETIRIDTADAGEAVEAPVLLESIRAVVIVTAKGVGVVPETRIVRRRAGVIVSETGARVRPRKRRMTTMDLKASAALRIDDRGARAGAGAAVESDARQGLRPRITTGVAAIGPVVVTSATLTGGVLSGNGRPPM